MKWNKEVNKVVMECFYRSKAFDEEGKPVRGYRQKMFGEWRENCFNQHSNVYVTKYQKLAKMNSFHYLNWKQKKSRR